MRQKFLFSTIAVACLCGCASPEGARCGISRGAYLDEKEHAALQREASDVEIIVPRTKQIKEGHRPMVSYAFCVEPKVKIHNQTAICIPDFKVLDARGVRFAESIPNELASQLRDKKMFRQVSRTNCGNGLVLECAISKRTPGSLALKILAGTAPAYCSIEGRFVLDGVRAGQFQINSQKLMTGVGWMNLAEGSTSSMVAAKIVDMLEDIKSGRDSGAACEDGTLLTDETDFESKPASK
jgi:hypothetical protein